MWYIFVIPFIIFFVVFLIIAKNFFHLHKHNGNDGDIIDMAESMQEMINTITIYDENEDKEEPKPIVEQTKTCEYCGSTVSIRDTKCDSCGATVKK